MSHVFKRNITLLLFKDEHARVILIAFQVLLLAEKVIGIQVVAECFPCTSLSVHQGEQLCGILQLQVLHAVPGVLAALLPLHHGHGSAVLHQVLDGTSRSLLRPPAAPRPLTFVDSLKEADGQHEKATFE